MSRSGTASGTCCWSQLFPPQERYSVIPQFALLDANRVKVIPDFAFHVTKRDQKYQEGRIVLVVEVKNFNWWPHRVADLEQQMITQAEHALETLAYQRVFCVAAIGCRWRPYVKTDTAGGLQGFLEDKWFSTVDESTLKYLIEVKKLIQDLDPIPDGAD